MRIKNPNTLQAFDHLNIGAILFDKDMSINDANSTILNWFDLDHDIIVGKPLTSLFMNIHPPAWFEELILLDDLSNFKENEFILNNGRLLVFSILNEPTGSLLIVRDNTEIHLAEERIKHLMIEYDAKETELNQVHRSLASANSALIGDDINYNVSAKDYITTVSAYYENIIAQMPCYVFWKNKHFVYLGCSENAAIDLVGLQSRKDIIGKSDYDFGWKGELVDEFRRIDKQIIKTRKPVINIEDTVVKPNGEIAHLLVNKVPLFSREGKVIGIAGISVDITQRKKMEAELQEAKKKAEILSQVKSEFISNMSHDIRTPLAGIVGLAKELRREVQSDHAKRDVDDLIASSDALLNLLTEILEIAQVESGNLEPNIKKFSLISLIESVYNLISPTINQKGLDFKFEIDENLPSEIYSDPSRIHRIILNILSNSLKFTEKGHIAFSAKVVKKTEQKAIIIFEISDTGIGIPKQKQKIIFSPFTRLTPSNKGIYGGSGLGLSIVRKFADDLDAELILNSEPKKGTCFQVLIPVKIPILCDKDLSELVNHKTLTSRTKSKHPAEVRKVPKLKKYVLLVEDNRIACRAAEYLLKDIHCVVDTAANAEEALKKTCENEYDCVFMDVGLPDGNGCELTRDIRTRSNSLNKHTPIIALTAHVMSDKKFECLKAGMQDVLLKPLTTESAVQVLSNLREE